MDQQQRHQYLDTMGIASWLPRRQLAAARPTPDWVWEYCWVEEGKAASSAQTKQSSQPVASPADVAAAAKQARAALSASFGDSEPAAKPQAQAPGSDQAAVQPAQASVARNAAVRQMQNPQPTPSQPDKSQSNLPQQSPSGNTQPGSPERLTPHQDIPIEIELPDTVASTEQAPFKLAFMNYGDCLVVDSLPPQSRQAGTQADAHHQILLDKILRSIRLQGGSCTGYYTLPWPMFASKSLDQGAEQAQLTVQHKLNKALQKQPVKTVLLLGEAASQMVLERREPLDQLRGMLFSLRSDVKTLATASLTEMMTLPGCKRDVWRDLQPLLDHLENSNEGRPAQAASG